MEDGFASKILNKLNVRSHESIFKNKHSVSNSDFTDDLPDGSCFSRALKIYPQLELNCQSTIRECEYIGSFPVTGKDQNERMEFVQNQLKQLRNVGPKKNVLLVISFTGIKVCTLDGKSVLMAHALRRISFATCDPDHRQFSFIAREPNGHFSLQYCHSFLSKDINVAEELSGVVGSAFRMAYAQQLQQTPPPISTGAQLTSQPPRQHTPSSPVLLGPAAFLSTCRSDATSPRPATRACWSKKLVGKIKQSDPFISEGEGVEMNDQASSSSFTGASNISPHQPSTSSHSIPNNLPLDLWSPASSCCSSSEENNSPTDVNSCKQIRDKPLMQKNLDVVQENTLGDDFKDMVRPSSGGYINEASSWETASASSSKFKCDKKAGNLSYHKKFTLENSTQTPTAPLTNGEVLLQPTVSRNSKRSFRSLSELSMPSSSSLSDTTLLNDHSETSSSCRSKRDSHGDSGCSSSSVSPPPPPERHDSLYIAASEERDLRDAPWFQAGIPREIALEILKVEPIGSFMVRESTSKPGCFALSLRVPREFHQSGTAHYLIMRTHRGYKIKGFTKEFGTLSALITHHSVMPELLPCPLSLSRYNPSFRKQDSDDMVDMNADSEYNLVTDFRKILANINV